MVFLPSCPEQRRSTTSEADAVKKTRAKRNKEPISNDLPTMGPVPTLDDKHVTENVDKDTLDKIKSNLFVPMVHIDGPDFGEEGVDYPDSFIEVAVGYRTAPQAEVEMDKEQDPQRSTKNVKDMGDLDEEDFVEMETPDGDFMTFFLGHALWILSLVAMLNPLRYMPMYYVLFSPANFFCFIYSPFTFVHPFILYRRWDQETWKEARRTKADGSEGLRSQVCVGKHVICIVLFVYLILGCLLVPAHPQTASQCE